ncbi:MAG: hypothetical protein EOP39_16160 [Rubrivivax sp.]|nr:MAG: hypothetical protein EOP39_16160 [Rubrivivax sp.]
MNDIQTNEDPDTPSRKRGVQEKTSASSAGASSHVRQTKAAKPEKQFGEGEHEDDSEDDGSENVQHQQQQAADSGSKPTAGSELAPQS